MEACVLGSIKSDGYRFLARIYGLIWESVQKTKSTKLDADDKGYVAYFLKHLNQFELLKRKKYKLLCLVMGYLENAKRYFKRDGFKMSFDEPNWQQDTIHDYTRYYNDRMCQSENGKLLLIEKAVVAREVGKLIKYYNYMFYQEVCPEAIVYFYKDTTQAVLNLDRQDEIKDQFLNQAKYFHYCPYSAEDADDFSNMNDMVKEAIITHVPQSIICKILDKNEPYIPPVLIDHVKERRERLAREQEQSKGENGNSCHSEEVKRTEESNQNEMLHSVQHDNHFTDGNRPPRQASPVTPPKEENLGLVDDAELTSPLAGEVDLQSKSGEGFSSHNEKDIPVVNDPLILNPSPAGEKDLTAKASGMTTQNSKIYQKARLS